MLTQDNIMEERHKRGAMEVAAFLSHFTPDKVMSGITLYMNGDIDGGLPYQYWEAAQEMPTTKWSVFMNGLYWSPKSNFVLADLMDIKINKDCSVCGTKYHVYNVVPCNKKEPQHKWRCRLECSNQDCLHEEYYEELRSDIIEKYGRA